MNIGGLTIAAIDIFFLAVVLILTIRCAIRGFIEEVMSMAAVIAGIACAFFFSGLVANLLSQWLGQTFWNQIIAFLGVFLVVYLIVKLFESAIHRAMEKLEWDNLNHFLGFVLGLAEGILVSGIVLFIITLIPYINTATWLADSIFARILSPFFPAVRGILHI